jgi:hypothetical protein
MNEAYGWISIAAGLLFGLALGPGADRETWLGGYGSRTRRLLRLSHVSFFGLGFINVLFERAALSVVAPVAPASRVALMAGSAGVSLACLAAAFVRPMKWALPPFALLVFAAVLAAAAGQLLAHGR